MAARIVRAKILNQRRVLLRAQRELRSEEVGEAAATLRVAAAKAVEEKSLEELRGVEGSAAAAYWRGFAAAVRHPELTFGGRSHRPPRDEVNALLSFGYTFLGVVQESHVWAAGLDPCLGCFHEIDYNRPSLALDLIEEFRPVAVDALVLTMVNRRQFGRGDFTRPEEVRRAQEILEGWEEGEEDGGAGEGFSGGVYLAEGARRVFLRAFFDRLRERVRRGGEEGEERELREWMREQVYTAARVFEGKSEEYVGFEWR
jgi:CRISPR-associated protein Cas1